MISVKSLAILLVVLVAMSVGVSAQTIKNAPLVEGYHNPLYTSAITNSFNGRAYVELQDPSLIMGSLYANSWGLMAVSTGNTLNFRRGAANVMTLDGVNGAAMLPSLVGIGIGTAIPVSALQIEGNIAYPSPVITLGSTTSGLNSVLSEIRAQSTYNTDSAIIKFEGDGAFSGGNNPGRITFWTTPAGNVNPAERVRITNLGNVGIGNTNPSEKLVVTGNTLVSGNSVVSGTTTATSGLVLGNPATGPVGMLKVSPSTGPGSAPVLQIYNTTGGWVNIASSGSSGGGSGTSQWTTKGNGIYYGDAIPYNTAEPVYVHAGGTQWIGSNLYYNNSDWYSFDGFAPSLGMVFSDSGISFAIAPIQGDPDQNITRLFNTNLRLPAQGGIIIGSSVSGTPLTGTLKMSGATLQVFDNGVWKDVNDNPIVNIPAQEWQSCTGGVCYMGVTSGSATTVSNNPSADIISGQWVGCSGAEYSCLQENNNFLTTNTRSTPSVGQYTIPNFNIPLGTVIQEVKIEALCRIVGQSQNPGRIYMQLRKGAQFSTTAYRPVSSFSFQWYSEVITTALDGSAWEGPDLDGLSFHISGHSPYAIETNSASLVAGTNVLMEDGSVKTIEKIVVGDNVVSYDVDSNEFVVREVLSTSKEIKKFLTINNELSLSPDHLVYVKDKEYIFAEEIVIGDKLILEDGSFMVVNFISDISNEEVSVYDFSVDYPNNFFANGYLVHNAPGDPVVTVYGSTECQRARVTVLYRPSADAKVVISEQTGSAEFKGLVSSPGFAADNIAASESISGKDIYSSGTMQTNKICLGNKCITDWAQAVAPTQNVCIWQAPSSALPDNWHVNRINIVGLNNYASYQCRVSCAAANPVCPDSVGIRTPLFGMPSLPLVQNPFVCDYTSQCVPDTENLCNVGVNYLMPMKYVSIESTNGIEICQN